MKQFKRDKEFKNYHSNFIECEDLWDYIVESDNNGDGMVFHHKYKNKKGEECTQLTPLNT